MNSFFPPFDRPSGSDADSLARGGAAQAGRRLYLALLASTVLGLVLPAASILLKAGGQPEAWRTALQAVTVSPEYWVYEGIRRFLERHPRLLALSWHQPESAPRYLDYYVHYGRFSLLVLAAMLACRRRILRRLDRLMVWVRQPDHRRARRLILASGLFVVFSYQTKAFWGFYWPGIAGWTQQHNHPRITSKPPAPPANGAPVDPADFPFLKSALVEQNARYLREPGYLTNHAMFLHFSNGRVLPANYELTEMPFPHYAFGNLHGQVSHPRAFFRIVKSSLENRRRNRRFLLPMSISYPNHSPYVPIDYTDYPPADMLRRISFWTLTVRVDARRNVEIVQASRGLTIDAD